MSKTPLVAGEAPGAYGAAAPPAGGALPATMKGTYITEYGDNSVLKLGELPMPVVEDGWVLVRVHAASLNPVDFKHRSTGELFGMVGLKASRKTPYLIGLDVSGTIVEVGTGVTGGWAVGDEVMSMVTMGACSEYVRVNHLSLAKKPARLTHAEAASIPLAALTANQALAAADVREGCKVLVTAGAGGVGSIAIQLAKHVYGAAEVATTASSGKRSFVESLGADRVVDYRSEKFADVLSGFDVAIDGTAEVSECAKVLRPGGKVVTLLGMPTGANMVRWAEYMKVPPLNCVIPAYLNLYNCCGIAGCCTGRHVGSVLAVPDGAELAEIAAHYEAGRLRPCIDSVFPLDKVVDAMAHLERGRAMGKVVVEVIPGSAAGVTLTGTAAGAAAAGAGGSAAAAGAGV